MKTENTSSTAQPRYRMPAEWESQERLWFSWPKAAHLWEGKMHRVHAELLRIIAIVSKESEIGINGLDPELPEVEKMLSEVPGLDRERILFSKIPNNDAWCRDHGPTFVEDRESGQLVGLDWNFNAWGKKYEPWTEDNKVAARMLERLEIDRIQCPFVGEGGGLEVDGAGTVMLTESVWLNPNRNLGIKTKEIESWLLEHLGCQQALWFTEGLKNDDTDGHVDMFARFVQKDAMVVSSAKQSSHPQYLRLQQIKEQLTGFRTLTGGHFDTIELPMPDPVVHKGELCPTTYGNFLIYNDWVFVPQFDQEKSDAYAMAFWVNAS